MRARHRALAVAFGNQPEQVVRAAQERTHHVEQNIQVESARSAVTYARERNLEREAVAEERELMRDALKRSECLEPT